jgi:hypothetical protein
MSSGTISDPAAVASFLESASPSLATSAVAGNLVRRWVARDPGAAERWALALPEGASRDEALTGLLQAGNTETIERVIREYSTAAARANGAMVGALQLARTDPGGARRLVNEHITDPEQRNLAERQLEIAASRGNSVFTINPAGGVIAIPPGTAARTCGFSDPTSGKVLPC